MKSKPLQVSASWRYEESGERQHYLIEIWLGGHRAGRAHGWFERRGPFVLEKIELERAQRSKGYGSAVIEQLRAKAREKECPEFIIRGARANNLRAIKLYESLGARPVETALRLFDFVISPP
ncbi:N-acetyltransferase [Lysobacter sp. N42]|uniref:GNAT family N-acetyltransferase n=1 Tax=Lysobacter sp. N42 TaxID=2545719 RepID=UPI001049B5CB|nr:GNAT family N-acetyltransferase [Lysobacter sp. N42]TCZ78545.1 GNAT family N-acetyltransferase [Lysobacter sp. N42]